MNPEPTQHPDHLLQSHHLASAAPSSAPPTGVAPSVAQSHHDSLLAVIGSLNETVQHLSAQISTGLTPGLAKMTFPRRPPPVDTSYGPYNPPLIDRRPPADPVTPGLAPRYVPPHMPSHQRPLPPRASGVRPGDPYVPVSREPLPIASIRFSGASVELESFLLDIREQLRLFDGCFASDKHKINWVANHFGVKDKKIGSASHTWFMGLLRQNAHEQGSTAPFQDFYALPYVLPPLSTLAFFFHEMVVIFSDKEADATARKALAACRQGFSSVSDYNSRFLALVYQVSLTEESRVLAYEDGLHPDLAFCCCLQPGWSSASTLTAKIALAAEGAKTLDRLSALPSFNLLNNRRPQHAPRPLISKPSAAFSVPVHHSRGSRPMDVDVAALDPADPMNAIRRICWDRKLCFYCLRAFDASHRDGRTQKCPNPKASAADRLALLHSAVPVKTQEVAAVDEDDFWEGIDPAQQVATQAALQAYWQSVNAIPDSSYPSPPADPQEVELSVVRVLSATDSAKFLVPVTMPGAGISFTALIDTGAQGCFIDRTFATNRRLSLTSKPVPVRCVSFDGSPGIGGVVTNEWVGDLILGDVSNSSSPFSLSVTNLGCYQAIIGLPWLDSVQARLVCGAGRRYLEFEGLSVAALDAADPCIVDCESSTSIPFPVSPLPSPSLDVSDGPAPPASSPALPPEFDAYSSVFSPQETLLPPHRSFDCEIKLKPGSVAPFGGLYTLTPEETVTLRAYLDEQLAKGNIVPSSSAAAAPIFFVKVPGKKDRPVVDYRALNKVTIRDSYPIPVIGWLLNQISGCKYFAKIDLKAAFNLLRVAEGHEWLTAFRTPWGLFEYRVMPFGLANAPAIFQRFIQSVLREYLDVFCFVYLDDILIFSRTRSDHVDHVSKVLSKLRDHKLTASAEKCSFFSDKVLFLGFVITPKGISMDPAKLSTITDWPYPSTTPELLRFLGFANFYRRFISHFSHIVTPLTALTRKNVPTASLLKLPAPQAAFSTLKRLFSSSPFLLHFDFTKPRVLHVDCSGVALSGILSQTDAVGRLRPVAYYSKKLTPAEQRWQVHDQELGAVVACFHEWRCWLAGANVPVAVFSDHSNLRYFMSAQHLTPRQARWASFLSSFSFEILHTPGKLNPADPASRRPDFVSGRDPGDRVVLLGHRVVTESDVSMAVLSLSSSDHSLPSDPHFMPVDSFILHCLQELYAGDSLILAGAKSFLRYENDLWWWRDRLYVPEAFRVYIIGKMHGDPAAGHWGVFRTLDLLTRSFSWPNVRADVLAFTSSCVRCQQIRVDHRKPQGELVPLPIPDRPWSTLGVDFVVKLPLSNGFDSVLVFIDHLTKAAHFVPARESWNAAELARQFLSSIFRLHGLPDRIVSDRGPTFVSRFWTAVQRHLHIAPAPSTAFHPETDGQTERVNGVLEDYLRYFVNDRQDDWALWLPLAEFSYNNTPSSSTSCSPFFATHGFHPRFNSLTTASSVPSADEWITSLHKTQDALLSRLAQAKADQARFYNKGRRVADHFAPGDLVWLSRRNLKTARPSSKLDVRRVGPFPVDRMVGTNAVKLVLPPAFRRLHPVFNLSLISRYVAPISTDRVSDLPVLTRLAEEFLASNTVTHVRGFRQSAAGEFEYLLRFGDGDDGLNDAWTPISSIPPFVFPALLAYQARLCG